MLSSLVGGDSVGLLIRLTLGSSVGGVFGMESIAKRFEDGGDLGLVEHMPWASA
jgi:hypothetical protein